MSLLYSFSTPTTFNIAENFYRVSGSVFKFDKNDDYVPGNYVIFGNKLYSCTKHSKNLEMFVESNFEIVLPIYSLTRDVTSKNISSFIAEPKESNSYSKTEADSKFATKDSLKTSLKNKVDTSSLAGYVLKTDYENALKRITALETAIAALQK